MARWIRPSLPLALAACASAGPPSSTPSIREDAALTEQIEALLDGFRGDAGVYVRHLRTGASVFIRGDEIFPTASLIKIPLLLTLYDRAERGLLELDAALPFPDTLHYYFPERTDVAAYLAPGDTLPLSEIAFLMTSVSDNIASLWIQALIGGGRQANDWLAANGYTATRVNARTVGREEAREEFGWGQTTPREIAELLVMIREGTATRDAAASEQIYRLLTSTYWRDVGVSQIPPHVQVASKQGFVDASRSEVLLVNAPTGDYVLAVITKNQRDTSHLPQNEGYRLIRAISRAVYTHFNPRDPWRPPPS